MRKLKCINHFMTITRHRMLVLKGCFQIGLYWQGLTHDLSKYMPDEFLVGVRYYQGTRSPNAAEREEKGYSCAWMHHKGRNKHHYEYWTDYSLKTNKMEPAPMPRKYIAEMVMDRIAACKIYKGKDYTTSSALEYYDSGLDHSLIHPSTRRDLRMLLKLLSTQGELKTYTFIRQKYLHNDNFFNRFVAKKIAERNKKNV